MVENVVIIAVWLGFFGMMYRLERYKVYWRQLLDDLGKACDSDIMEGRDYKWRWDAYEKPDYFTVALSFWRPFDYFYPDKSFLDIDKRDPSLSSSATREEVKTGGR